MKSKKKMFIWFDFMYYVKILIEFWKRVWIFFIKCSPPNANEPKVIQPVDWSRKHWENRDMLHVRKSKWLWSSLNSSTLLIFAWALPSQQRQSKMRWNSIFDKTHNWNNFLRKMVHLATTINNGNAFLTLSHWNSNALYVSMVFLNHEFHLLPMSLLCAVQLGIPTTTENLTDNVQTPHSQLIFFLENSHFFSNSRILIFNAQIHNVMMVMLLIKISFDVSPVYIPHFYQWDVK